MVHAVTGLPLSADTNLLTHTESQSSSDSQFAEQLANAIEGVIQESGNGSQYDINIQTGQGPNGNGFTITVTDESAGSTTPSTTTSASTTSNSTTSSTSTSSSTSSTSTSSSTTTPSTSSTTLTAAQLATMTPAQAYWAQQPPAVQALENMPYDQRPAYAAQLEAQGYTIDQEIMVDGEDPLAVMINREQLGYTWVPSATQPPLEMGPGLTMPGMTSYDPNNPPPGSILTSTAFALGTNLASDPLVSQAQIQQYVLDQNGVSSSS